MDVFLKYVFRGHNQFPEIRIKITLCPKSYEIYVYKNSLVSKYACTKFSENFTILNQIKRFKSNELNPINKKILDQFINKMLIAILNRFQTC